MPNIEEKELLVSVKYGTTLQITKPLSLSSNNEGCLCLPSNLEVSIMSIN